MKTKIMLMHSSLKISFVGTYAFLMRAIGNHLRVWRKNYLSVYDHGDGDPDDNGNDGLHHDGGNLIL